MDGEVDKNFSINI